MTILNASYVNLTNLNLTIFRDPTDTIGTQYGKTGLRAVDTLFGTGVRVNVRESPIACEADRGGNPAESIRVQEIGPDGKTVLSNNPFPMPQTGVLYIVPIPVQNTLYAAGRRDVIGMGNTRQQDGRPIGAEGFVYKGTAADLIAALDGSAPWVSSLSSAQ